MKKCRILSHLVGINVRLLTALILAVAAAKHDLVVNILIKIWKLIKTKLIFKLFASSF